MGITEAVRRTLLGRSTHTMRLKFSPQICRKILAFCKLSESGTDISKRTFRIIYLQVADSDERG
jgi:hypothetical protein